MASVIEYDSSYLNTTPGKYKISCLTFGALGLLALFISGIHSSQYASIATFAFWVTAILLLILICKASLRQNEVWTKIEAIICVVLTVLYFVATVYIVQLCWYFVFHHFQLGPVVGSAIATICSIIATLTYLSDATSRVRGCGSGSTSNV